MPMLVRNRPSSHQSLTDQVLQFQRTGSGFDRLIEKIAPLVYRFPLRERSANEDDCGNFYCYFMPRVPNLIRRFSFQGRAFEVYLITCLRYQYRSYARRQLSRLRSANTAQDETFWPTPFTNSDVESVAETPTEPVLWAKKLMSIDENGAIADPIMARQVILLSLKASQELTEPEICRIADLTGVDRGWLAEKVSDLHSRLEERRERRDLLRSRRDQAFFRLKLFEGRVKAELDRVELRRLDRLIRQEKVHLENARRELSKVPVSPTHRDIADVLDMPKGSVDSALYYMRTAMVRMSGEGSDETISAN